MDINEAALRMKVIEEYANQVAFLRREASSTESYSYASSCNEQAAMLLAQMSLMTVVDKENKPEVITPPEAPCQAN